MFKGTDMKIILAVLIVLGLGMVAGITLGAICIQRHGFTKYYASEFGGFGAETGYKHGLGTVPKLTQIVARCVQNIDSSGDSYKRWTVGEEIVVVPSPNFFVRCNSDTCTLIWTSQNVVIGSQTFNLDSPGTGTQWLFGVRAYA